ncbi:YwdI family protein [Niallia endozanthoxylica]|uniref:YwdI family protein n=1 Tax=Niallia endozanthoxylica TaxID=2036016 RepID=A0A5J5GW71_9BACI|nr:YwdI family protein [Niallia endozanthoxylica]KAA9012541.1 hypothetical protein F4V44_25650 [Niallia endozanthoxylica]
MNISVGKLLDKIGKELQEAKQTGSDAKIREHAYAMKTLCELILESPSHAAAEVSGSAVPHQAVSFQQQPISFQPQSVTIQPPQKKLEVEDGANGDSIFDF